MPHELEILEDGSAAFVSGRGKTAWHGLGEVVEGLMTSQEALERAQINWLVTKEPAYQAIKREGGGPRYVQVQDKFFVTRDTDNKVLGAVGSDYTVCQNWEAFAFLDTLIDSGEAVFDTAGAMFGGKRVFVSALLPETVEVAGGDKHEMYMLFSNSHDGSKAVNVVATPIRTVCRNTQIMAIGSAKQSWSVRHTTTLEGRLQEAREALQLTHKYADAFSAEVEKLLQVEVDADKFRAILEASFPEQKAQKAKNVEAVLANWETSETIADDQRNTGWGAYNATTEWLSWGKQYRTEEARVKSVLGGWGTGITNKVTNRLLELAR
jgi:phage/plasmid-like protein (TIGR03299 family)